MHGQVTKQGEDHIFEAVHSQRPSLQDEEMVVWRAALNLVLRLERVSLVGVFAFNYDVAL